MAQKNVSIKTARVGTEKKSKCEKEEVKLPALSPTKKLKNAPMPAKPTPVPGAKVKALPPKSSLRPTACSVPTKLSAPVKAQVTQSTAQKSAAEGEVAEGTGPELSSALAAEGRSAPATSENVLLDGVAMADAPPNSVEANIADPSPEDVAAEAAAAAEEVKRLRKLNGNGMMKLIYEQYDELFPIEDGSTTQANIDEVYCLSFVMPNCLVRLSQHSNLERFQREENGVFDSLVHEDPRGTYHDLEKDRTYYVVVEQEADQLRRDQEATKALWDGELQKQKKADKDDGRGFETCSCIYGNPCVDEYGCRDWHSRFAVATKNGWKGF